MGNSVVGSLPPNWKDSLNMGRMKKGDSVLEHNQKRLSGIRKLADDMALLYDLNSPLGAAKGDFLSRSESGRLILFQHLKEAGMEDKDVRALRVFFSKQIKPPLECLERHYGGDTRSMAAALGEHLISNQFSNLNPCQECKKKKGSK